MDLKFLSINLILALMLLLCGCSTRDASAVRYQRNAGTILDDSVNSGTVVDIASKKDDPGQDTAGKDEKSADPSGKNGPAGKKDDTNSPQDNNSNTDDEGENEKEETKEPEVEDLGDYFMPAIEDFKEYGILPDGQKITLQGNGSLEDCEYAMEDVDKDGQMELMFRYAGTMLEVYIDPEAVAQTGEYIEPYKLGTDMFTAVYSYDIATDNYTSELFVNYVCTFYNNGHVMVEANDGVLLSDADRSYQIYNYDPATDSYAYAGFIYEWNRNIAPEGAKNAPFPSAVDKDENNRIYSLEYQDRFESGYIYDDEDMKKLYSELFDKKQRLYWYYI